MVDFGAGTSVKDAGLVLSPFLSVDRHSHGGLVKTVHDLSAAIELNMSVGRLVISSILLAIALDSFVRILSHSGQTLFSNVN